MEKKLIFRDSQPFNFKCEEIELNEKEKIIGIRHIKEIVLNRANAYLDKMNINKDNLIFEEEKKITDSELLFTLNVYETKK